MEKGVLQIRFRNMKHAVFLIKLFVMMKKLGETYEQNVAQIFVEKLEEDIKKIIRILISIKR